MRVPKTVLLISVLVAVVVAAAAAQPQAGLATSGLYLMSAHAADPGPAKTKTSAAAANSDYAGTDACLSCHDDQHQRFKNTVMGKILLGNPRTELEKRGCEACHGPGRAHVEAGGGKDTIALRFGKDSKATVEEQNAACLQCHAKGNRLFWRGSPHESRALACVDCHQVKQGRKPGVAAEARFNAPLTEVSSTKKSQPELCLQCHQMRRAQLQRSSHMPYREGKVTCTSCHNPHGSPNPKQLIQSTMNENCYSCHAERRGPFLWEHPPVMENCGNCHDPHGSTNPQLLKMRTPRLCQQCHLNSGHPAQNWGVTAPNGTPAGFATRVLNRGCTNCHAQMHGSNHPAGKTYLR